MLIQLKAHYSDLWDHPYNSWLLTASFSALLMDQWLKLKTCRLGKYTPASRAIKDQSISIPNSIAIGSITTRTAQHSTAHYWFKRETSRWLLRIGSWLWRLRNDMIWYDMIHYSYHRFACRNGSSLTSEPGFGNKVPQKPKGISATFVSCLIHRYENTYLILMYGGKASCMRQ